MPTARYETMTSKALRADLSGRGAQLASIILLPCPAEDWTAEMLAEMVGVDLQAMLAGRISRDDAARLFELQRRLDESPLLIIDEYALKGEEEVANMTADAHQKLIAAGHEAVRVIYVKECMA